jgi:hypothetical protein
MKISDDTTEAIYFSHRLRPRNDLTLNGQNHVKYLGVIFDVRLHGDCTAKAFRTFIRIYSLFTSERFSANIKLTLHNALIRSIMTYACSAWELTADTHILKL